MGPHDDELDYIVEPAAGTNPISRIDHSRGVLRDIGGARLKGTGVGQSVEIPPNTEFFTCFAEDVPLVMYPISRDQGLSCLVASGDHASFRFFGRSYME